MIAASMDTLKGHLYLQSSEGVGLSCQTSVTAHLLPLSNLSSTYLPKVLISRTVP